LKTFSVLTLALNIAKLYYRFPCKSLRPLKNAQFCSSSRKAKILTAGIYGIFRGLKFEPDTEIGQKGVFFKGLFFAFANPILWSLKL